MNFSATQSLQRVVALAILASLNLHAQPAPVSKPASQMARLAETRPHQRVWQMPTANPTGGTALQPDSERRVVEIATGMNYWDGWQWVPSDPSFEVTADGFAATRLQHRVLLNANLNAVGAVTVTTGDGITLRSTPVGIGLYDAVSGRSAVIGGISDCDGVLVSSNQVVYENAFNGVCADVIFRIDRGSFEQDVLITGRLDPSDYGFSTDTTRLQIFTEFYETPEPDRIRRPIRVEQRRVVRDRMASPDFEDEVLGWPLAGRRRRAPRVMPPRQSPSSLQPLRAGPFLSNQLSLAQSWGSSNCCPNAVSRQLGSRNCAMLAIRVMRPSRSPGRAGRQRLLRT